MSDSSKAVFLSYASQDAASAKRICDALRAAGIEAWFDQSELRGGDTWDKKIRTQIKTCTLFLPIISAQTEARVEGYFRREWKLAVERTLDMAAGVAFIVPVVIDDTSETDAAVPEEFMRYQWTRLPGGAPTPEFAEQIRRLLDAPRRPAAPAKPVATPAPTPAPRPVPNARPRRFPVWPIAVLLAVAAGLAAWRLRPTPPPSAPAAAPAVAAPAAPAPAPAASADPSVAVLAFTDLSEKRDSEYLSDGLSEELLNVLAKVPGLRVAARTSAFSFKGRNVPIPEIAAKLNVAYVVEGSIQRAGDTLRITAQLIKAADGYHVWSEHFDRELKNVFAVQDEIAGLIAQQLSLKLGASSAPAAAVNPRALELYLRAREATRQRTRAGFTEAETLLREVLGLEPGFARGHAALADVLNLKWDEVNLIGLFGQRHSPQLGEIRAEIDRALALDPNLAEAHAARGNLALEEWQFTLAAAELRQAIVLNPNYASAHQWLARALMTDGRFDEALPEMQQAASLDPLSHRIQDNLGFLLLVFSRYEESKAALDRALAIRPNSDQALYFQALLLDQQGRSAEALGPARRALALDFDNWSGSLYRVFVRAGRQAEADAWPPPSTPPFPSDLVYRALALGRVDEAASHLDADHYSWRDVSFLLTDPSMDPIRADPRFTAFINQLGVAEAYARAQAWRAAQPHPAPAKP